MYLALSKDGTQAYWVSESVASDPSHQSKLIEDKMTNNRNTLDSLLKKDKNELIEIILASKYKAESKPLLGKCLTSLHISIALSLLVTSSANIKLFLIFIWNRL